MTVFDRYARVYDALYGDKDYAAEAAFVERHLARGAGRRILEIGCGTGAHAVELARRGFEVTGVDLSTAMLAHAARRHAGLDPALRPKIRYLQGDARSLRLGETFDAAVSLFHVVSYQVGDSDLAATFATVSDHLRPGSPFLFDFWYGPAVLEQKPEAREKRVEEGGVRITRNAVPKMRDGGDCVDIRYTVRLADGRDGERSETIEETHTMRYFFLPGLQQQLARAGLELVSTSEMTTGAPLSTRTWSAFAVARKA